MGLKLLTSGALPAMALTAHLLTVSCGDSGPKMDPKTQKALGLYAQGFNALVQDPKDAVHEYYQIFGQPGPQPGRKYSTAKLKDEQAVQALAKAKDAFEEANETAPKSMAHLKPLAQKALDQIRGVTEGITAIKKYYGNDRFKEDDGGQRAQQLHERITESSKGFQDTLEKLQFALSQIEDRHAALELRHQKKNTRSYWFRAFNFQAKKLIEARDDAKTYDKMFKRVHSDHQKLKGFAKGSKHATFKNYVALANSFHEAAERLQKLHRLPSAQSHQMEQGKRAVVHAYNQLVEMGNSLYKIEAAGKL